MRIVLWSVIFCLIRLFSSLQHEHFSTSKSLQPVVGTEWQSLYKTGKTTLRDLIKTPLGHFSFYFCLTRCMHRARNASVWSRCSSYTLYFESLLSFSPQLQLQSNWMFYFSMNLCQYCKLLLESWPTHVSRGTSTQIFIFWYSVSPKYLIMTDCYIVISVMQQCSTDFAA